MSNGLRDGLEALIPAYLAAQRWYAGAEPPDPNSVRVERGRELWAGADDHRLWHATVAVGGTHYQLLIGERPAGERAEFLHGREAAILGSVDSAVFYDAVLDSELARVLLQVASDGEQSAARARPMNSEQSNTSLVFDDRLILKVYRRLHEGRNPDVEVTTALAAAGFGHVALPLVTWREDPYDLAFGQQFLNGGSEGWALALTSLRDLYNSACEDPAQAGGDFANDARRLGRMTAEMHQALAATFGVVRGPAVGAAWDALLERTVARLIDGQRLGRPRSAGAQPRCSWPDCGPWPTLARRSGSTATITSARSWRPTAAGTCSTSRANRPNHCRSGPL